ncbi:MAG: GDP-L-fucose synthase [Rhodomicrobium sp.]
MSYILSEKRVWVAGCRGLVGSALVRRLAREDCVVLTTDRTQVDLQADQDVESWIAKNRPHAIFLAAAKVGGILANKLKPAEFLYQNLMIELNVIQAAYKFGVEKLLFLGSSCIYPREAEQPIAEEALLTGALEPTNEPYAIAKIAGLKLCQSYRRQYGCNFISAMPTNLYGPNDNFHPENSHVPAALLSRFHKAKMERLPQVAVWGTGSPRREFLFVDDLADACVFLMKNYSGPIAINVGNGEDVTIQHFAELVRSVVGYSGDIVFDVTYPDGAPRKVLNVDKLSSLGWMAKTGLRQGLQQTYQWYCDNQENLRKN